MKFPTNFCKKNRILWIKNVGYKNWTREKHTCLCEVN